jgi:microsomal dipeptidase-like Zn-dependent dipeptidase
VLLRILGWACLLSLVMCSGPKEGGPVERVGNVQSAIEDSENTTAAKWWMFTNQTADEVTATISRLNARIVDVKVDNLSPYPFTVTYVQNTGTYAKGALGTGWFWHPDVDWQTIASIDPAKERLIALKGYDTGCGTSNQMCSSSIRFTAVGVANTGADAKEWWAFNGNLSDLTTFALNPTNNTQTDAGPALTARITTIQSYQTQGSIQYGSNTNYTAIMIANTGADQTNAPVYTNMSVSDIGNNLTSNGLRPIDLTYAGNGNYNVATEKCGTNCPGWWWQLNQTYAQAIAFAQTNNARILTADTHPGCATGGGVTNDSCFDTIFVSGSLGTDSNTASTKLRGFVDLHTHPLSNLAFSGKLVYGGVDVGSTLPADPNCNRRATASSIDQALGHDGSTHGGYNAVNNQCGDSLREIIVHGFQSSLHANDPGGDSTGADNFSSWPTFDDVTHQKMWVDWMFRSFQNGQRVLVALAVNNKTLGDTFAGTNITNGQSDYDTRDSVSADLQIAAIQAFVGRHGPNAPNPEDNFMEVALSSADAQRIIQSGRMAVVIGMEVDAIGDFYNSASESQITTEVQRLWNEGVRYIFPIHVLDNAFGGTALYVPSFDWSNHRESHHWWSPTCSKAGDGVSYDFKTDLSNTDGTTIAAVQALKLNDLLGSGAAAGLPNPLTFTASLQTLIGQYANALQPPPTPPCCGASCPPASGVAPTTGVINSVGLLTPGHIALREMAKRGMLIDVDHMSQSAMNSSLDDFEQKGNYPTFSGHSDIKEKSQDQNSKAWVLQGTERNVSPGQYGRIGKLHGMAGIGSANMRAVKWTQTAIDTINAMGGRSAVAFGTDTDGLAPGMPSDFPKPVSAPAGMFSHETGTLCTVNCQHDQQHVFYRDALGAIVHVFYDNGAKTLANADGNTPGDGPHRTVETWAGTASALVPTPAAAGTPVTMFTDSMQQHVFFRDVNNAIQHVYRDKDTGMHQEVWAQGSGNSQTGPAAASDPTVVYEPSNHDEHLFYIDAGGTIHHVFYDPSNGRKAETGWGTNAVGTPATMISNQTSWGCFNNCAHNQQHLFYRDTSNRIIHYFYDEGDGMHGPETWAGQGSSPSAPAAAGDPKVLFTPNMQHHLFYRDSVNSNLQHVLWDNPSSTRRVDQPWAFNVKGNPAVMFTHETGTACTINCEHDLQHVFIRNSLDQIAHPYYDETTSTFSGPSEIWAYRAASDPTAFMSTDMQQHVFFDDYDSNLQHVFWVPPGFDVSVIPLPLFPYAVPNGDTWNVAGISLKGVTTWHAGSTNHEMWIGSTDIDYLPPIQYGPTFPRPTQTIGGTTKVWDYNYHGVAHYGMLPDFLVAAMQAPSGTDLVMNNVLWGAQYFIDTWKAAESASSRVFSSNVSTLGNVGVVTGSSGATTVSVGTDGNLYTRTQTGGTFGAPVALTTGTTDPGFAPINAVVAVGQQTSTQNDAFVVGNDGAVYRTTQSGTGAWQAPTALTPGSFAAPGAPLATANQGGQLGVFVVGNNGAVDVIWWNPTLGWLGPVAITPSGYAPSGAWLATGTRSSGELDVFSIGTDGSLKYMAFNLGVWSGPYVLSVTGFAPPGAPVAAAKDVHGYLNAFVIGNDGALYTKWDATPLWSGPTAITATGFAPPNGRISAVQFSSSSSPALDVFVVDDTGALDMLTNAGTSWQGPTALTAPGAARPGAATSAAVQGSQLDLIAVTVAGTEEWTSSGTGWSAPVAVP